LATIAAIKPSLRVRKKARTRETIVNCARKLFEEQGFDSTTLEQIAEAADIHKQTVLRYFRSKYDIALDTYSRRLDELEEGLRDPNRKVDVLTYWRDHVRRHVRHAADDAENFVRMYRFISSDPALSAHSLTMEARCEAILARALAEEAGEDARRDLYSTMLASFLVAANRNVAALVINSRSPRNLERACMAVVDFAIEKFPRREDALPL